MTEPERDHGEVRTGLAQEHGERVAEHVGRDVFGEQRLDCVGAQGRAAGVFCSRSTDATGAGRMQVLDRNWVVVGQTPAAGVLIGEGDAVLSVVKLTESNPC
ncbi:MAG: hypothetical protein ACXVXI_05315 [Mycobacteriaceae bacterium]